MLIALLADVHANREALEACLEDAEARGASRFVFLGDLVNYGADPEWVTGEVMRRVAAGAIAVRGNHDAAVGERRATMDSPAELAMEWTRVQLGADEREFLARLPLTVEDGERLFVHAAAGIPEKWEYVFESADAMRSLAATAKRLTFCGHVHVPALYSMSVVAKITAFRPTAGAPVPLLSQRRWLAVLGSVGQPRDGDPAASYATFDTESLELTYRRVPYDVATAAAKIRAAGLPEMLAERLATGR